MYDRIRPALRFLTQLMPRMWLLVGAEQCTGKPLSVIWCGPPLQRSYMVNRLFGNRPFESRYLGRRPVFMLDRLRNAHGADLGILAGPRWLLKKMQRSDDIAVPWWVEAELDIRAALDPAGRSKSLKDDLRRARNHRLAFERAANADSYRVFHERFYLPTITGSHGNSALLTDCETRRNSIARGEADLIWIRQDGEPLGGIVISYDGAVPVLRDLGIRDGDRAVRRTGVITAAYFFAIQYLGERGYERVRLGLSRPFLDDGVLTFKQKWRPTLTSTSKEAFLIRVGHLGEASRSFLSESSYIGERAGKLHLALIAANDDDFRTGKPILDRLSSIYGIDARSYIDVSGQRPTLRRAS